MKLKNTKKPLLLLSKEAFSNINESVRMGLNYLIGHYLILKDIKNANYLCNFLTNFDKEHYDHFVLMERINAVLGNTSEATGEDAINGKKPPPSIP